MLTLTDIATLIASSTMQPEGRRMATAATFGQQAELTLAHCETYEASVPTLADLRAAFARLTIPQAEDTGPVVSRRKTLSEIVAALDTHFGPSMDEMASVGSADRALPWFTATTAAFLFTEDPRQSTMSLTAAREAAELGDDFPRFLLALSTLPVYAGTTATPPLRSGDCGCNGTRYVQDNHAPDTRVTQLWGASAQVSSFTFRGQHLVREVAPLVELAGGAWNDSSYAIRSWLLADDGSWSRSDEPWPAARRPRAAALGCLGVTPRS